MPLEKLKKLQMTKYSIMDEKKLEHYEKKYERNPINRRICLSVKGYRCSVCGKLLEEEYGEVAKDVIEVHHAVPVSSMGEGYIVDPIKDLYPVCPNCHTILHKKNPPYTIDEARQLIGKGNKQ